MSNIFLDAILEKAALISFLILLLKKIVVHRVANFLTELDRKFTGGEDAAFFFKTWMHFFRFDST